MSQVPQPEATPIRGTRHAETAATIATSAFTQRIGDRLLGATPDGSTPGMRVGFGGDLNLDPLVAVGSGVGKDEIIFGSALDVEQTALRFNSFLNDFGTTHENRVGKYVSFIQQIVVEANQVVISVPIDAMDVHAYDANLYEILTTYPIEAVAHIDSLLVRVFARVRSHPPEVPMQAKIFNLLEADHRKMRELRPEDTGHLMAIKGFVIRTSDLVPEMSIAHFECSSINCNNVKVVRLRGGMIEEPTTCERCHQKQTFRIVHNQCKFGDKQYVKLQETPESIPAGATPQTVTVICYDDLYDSVRPGDRVTVTGVYRCQGMRAQPNMRTELANLKTFIDVIHFEKSSSRRVAETAEPRSLTAALGKSSDSGSPDSLSAAERIQLETRMRQIAARSPDVIADLVRSFAPSIWDQDDVKKGLLCQLVGGANLASAVTDSKGMRGEIHILLCGDPSSAKSQLLQYVHKVAPRGIYTSGKGSSAVGLTAYVSKDIDTKEVVLESGALVLSDRGVCCIDEFDKMDDSTRAILHEVMEQQTVSVAKAGIVCSLNARTAICASANPIHSKFDTTQTLMQNVNLPPTLISRFDLLYLLLDKGNEANDAKLAKHVALLYADRSAAGMAAPPATANQSDGENALPLLTQKDMSDYIAFARLLQPKLSEEAGQELLESYMELRNPSSNSSKSMGATPRQLESLIRLSEALAKLELTESVSLDHVREAVRLMKAAILAAATDPRTGRIDMNMLNSGFSDSDRQIRQRIESALEDVLTQEGFTSRLDVLRQRVLNKLVEEGSGNGEYSAINPDDRSTNSIIDQICRDAIGVRSR